VQLTGHRVPNLKERSEKTAANPLQAPHMFDSTSRCLGREGKADTLVGCVEGSGVGSDEDITWTMHSEVVPSVHTRRKVSSGDNK
jgi:hypothetical protein